MRSMTFRVPWIFPFIRGAKYSFSTDPDIPISLIEGNDIQFPLVDSKKLLPSKRSARLALLAHSDAADLFVLLCSFLLSTTSVVLVALVFHTQATGQTPGRALLYLPRVISSLSLTITSAVIMVAGKRYVLFKLARGGLRSQRVAVYNDPTIGNLASHLVLHGVEFPLFGLSAVWGLALVTGLTVNDSWEMGSFIDQDVIPVLSGPLDSTSNALLVTSAVEQLNFVMSSWCLGLTSMVGLINVTSANTDPRHPTGIIYYPPLTLASESNDYSFSTTGTMNGFNISLEQLSSVPSSAWNLSTIAQNLNPVAELWYDGSDNQTLSLVIVDKSDDFSMTFRINATAIIMGGTLSSYNNYTEFALNGTSWPNVMSTGNQWAQDIISVVCNATLFGTQYLQDFGGSGPLSLSDFVTLVDPLVGYPDDWDPEEYHYRHWSSVLNMALGAYSSAMLSTTNITELFDTQKGMYIQLTSYGTRFMPTYGIYILLLNTIASIIMLIITVKLRLASHLGRDFLNSARLLLDPLKKTELFNASLQTTVDALADPYVLVDAENRLLVTERKTDKEKEEKGEGRMWFRVSAIRKRKDSIELYDDSSTGSTVCDQ